jgi:hypothetical protein
MSLLYTQSSYLEGMIVARWLSPAGHSVTSHQCSLAAFLAFFFPFSIYYNYISWQALLQSISDVFSVYKKLLYKVIYDSKIPTSKRLKSP